MEQAVQPDAQLYHWLVSNMDKTQRLLGVYGLGLYTAPFGRFQIDNYQYILNTINQMRTGDAHTNDLSMCENMMVRYLGDMGRLIEEEEKDIKNPITWLQQGTTETDKKAATTRAFSFYHFTTRFFWMLDLSRNASSMAYTWDFSSVEVFEYPADV